MKSVQKKLNHLEKLKKDISAKLDKYEFNFDKENEKIDLMDLNFKKENNNNNKSNNILGKNYKEIMNKRLDDIMGKIDDNIINKNYSDLYKFLLSACSYKKIKQEKIKQNKEKEIEEKENKIIKEKEITEANEPIIKEIISRNNNNKNNQIIQSDNEINKSISENIEKEELTSQKEQEKQSELNNDLREIIQKKNNNNKKEKNIIVEYDGSGKIDLEELKSKQNSEILQKQQNIYLSNELLTLKNKLNNLRKDNEFLKSVINEKGMVKNTNVLEKFIGKFVERLSLNWDEIVEIIIDEILLDETYILNEIDLKKINYEKNKNILIKNLIKAGFGGILPEADENPSTNMDLIFDNIDFIKKVLNNVKQNEKDMKIKYNIK